MVMHDEDPIRPGAILALCTGNAVRSPMAEAMLKQMFGTRCYIQSAGVEATLPNAMAAEVMQETGIDIAGHTPRSYADLEETSFDLIIALSEPAYGLARSIAQSQSLDVEYWEVAEPPIIGEVPPSLMLEGFRRIRDDIRLHIENRFAPASAQPQSG